MCPKSQDQEQSAQKEKQHRSGKQTIAPIGIKSTLEASLHGQYLQGWSQIRVLYSGTPCLKQLLETGQFQVLRRREKTKKDA